jgi:hypothetical protein
MKKVKKEHYMPKTNSDGADVYCPLPADDAGATDVVDAGDDCVEKDVVERYSGNIDLRGKKELSWT